jgi:tetratricopeptide (TPR) repeat protein
VVAVNGDGPVSEFCAHLNELRINSGLNVPSLAKRLGLSRTQLYAILAGQITRPPDWERVVRPLVEACTRGDTAAVARWRQRHSIMTGVWEHLRSGQPRPGIDLTVPVQGAGPRQLPGAVSCFTGRNAELAQLTGLLGPGHGEHAMAMVITAIGGAAGVGKTALAVQWAHHIADRFPDGQLYVNLRGYDPLDPVAARDALAGLLRALGVPGADIPDEAEDRSRLYRSRLAGRRMLVMLDNAHDGDQVRPLLPGDPGCVAVITSRDALAGLVATDGAKRVNLDVLPLPDAIALLRSLIGVRAEEDPLATAMLATLCARLPLALRIAAELVTARPSAPLAALTAELAEARLDSLDAGDERADVRAVFSWSHRHLPDDAGEVFALIGLHPGEDLDAYVTAALTGTPETRARRTLVRLERASLIQATGTGRYAMHDLLRAYAREQAAARHTDPEQHVALTRLFDYYLAAAAAAMDVVFPAEAHRRPRVCAEAVAVPAMTGREDARAWLDRERANLVAVVTHAARHGWPRHATDLAATLYRYLIAGSHLVEATTIHEQALHAARESDDLLSEAGALNGLGGISLKKGRCGDAIGHYQAALDRYRRCDGRLGMGRVLQNLGLAEELMHNLQASVGYNQQAIAAYEIAGDRFGVADALSNLGGIEGELGFFDQGAEHLHRALLVFRELNDPGNEAKALSKIGDLHVQQGELAQAAACHQESLTLYEGVDHPNGLGAELTSLGQIKLLQGEFQDAGVYLRNALAVFRRTGYQYLEIIALRQLAGVLDAAGQPADARAELRKALQLAVETGNTYQQAGAHDALAENHHRDGDDAQARQHWRQALALYTKVGAAEADQVQARLDGAADEFSRAPAR